MPPAPAPTIAPEQPPTSDRSTITSTPATFTPVTPALGPTAVSQQRHKKPQPPNNAGAAINNRGTRCPQETLTPRNTTSPNTAGTTCHHQSNVHGNSAIPTTTAITPPTSRPSRPAPATRLEPNTVNATAKLVAATPAPPQTNHPPPLSNTTSDASNPSNRPLEIGTNNTPDTSHHSNRRQPSPTLPVPPTSISPVSACLLARYRTRKKRHHSLRSPHPPRAPRPASPLPSPSAPPPD